MTRIALHCVTKHASPATAEPGLILITVLPTISRVNSPIAYSA
ncbi:Uncharacterised protein [Yersinia enterocolitica]|nr:Uncharacterised protein [Yersinia enterocolitica]CRY22720.1 Uncharacterised protein [Yersinia enterocolitica]